MSGNTLARASTGYAFGTLTPDATTAKGPTIPDGVPPLSAFFSVETVAVRYRYDGTDPTSAVGHLANVGDAISLEGYANIKNLKIIATSGTASVAYTLER